MRSSTSSLLSVRATSIARHSLGASSEDDKANGAAAGAAVGGFVALHTILGCLGPLLLAVVAIFVLIAIGRLFT